jgi:hypothetical protein
MGGSSERRRPKKGGRMKLSSCRKFDWLAATLFRIFPNPTEKHHHPEQ